MITTKRLSFTSLITLVILGVSGCSTKTPTIENYSEEVFWENPAAAQNHDERSPLPWTGWAKRSYDFGATAALEQQVLCIPGLRFELEFYYDDQASWMRDIARSTYGDTVYPHDSTFAQLAGGETSMHFYNFPSRQIKTDRKPFNGSITRPEWPDRASPGPFEWQVEKLSDDILVISRGGEGSRNFIVVRGKTGWIIVGQTFNLFGEMQGVHETLIAATGNGDIEAVFPDHAHNDHSDHSGYFTQLGAKIILSEATQEQLKASGVEIDPASLISFSGTLQYQAANTTIEFHELTNQHAMGLSIAWLPEHKLLYQGDVLSVPQDGTLIGANALTRTFAAYLDKHNMVPERIVGNHEHSNISPDMFNRILAMPSKTPTPGFPSCEKIQQRLSEG